MRDILDELARRNVKLSLSGSIHDPTDPIGRLLFNVLAVVAAIWRSGRRTVLASQPAQVPPWLIRRPAG